MKKGFMKKLIATLSVALTVTVGAGVALLGAPTATAATTTTTTTQNGNFTTNASATWSGTTASYSGFSAGNYVATEQAYSFSDTEVMVFETTFVSNSLLENGGSTVDKTRFSFIYGEDTAEEIGADGNKLEGNAIITQNNVSYADKPITWTNAEGYGVTDGSQWANLPTGAGTLTYYVYPDGGTEIYVEGVRMAYVTAAKAAANLVASMPTTYTQESALARIADRNGHLGWAFSGSSTMEFSYSSLKVGKLTVASGTTLTDDGTQKAATHNPSNADFEWFVEHTQKTDSAITKGNFSSNVTATWTDTTASYSAVGAGSYVATNHGYSFASDEVLVFETTFVTNSVLSIGDDAYNKENYSFSFIYGADSASALASSKKGYSHFGQYRIDYAGGNVSNTTAGAAQTWSVIPASGTFTYYVHPDGSSDFFVDGVRNSYMTATDANANLNGTDDAADRDGVMGWVFTGAKTVDFSYSSLKVGKATDFTVGTGTPSSVTWIAEHSSDTTSGGTEGGGEDGGESGGETETLGNFTSSIGTAWSGTSASYTAVGNGDYIATDDSYTFTDTEVLVFETYFTANTIFTQGVDDYTKFNLTFIYGADSAAGVYTDASSLLGHTLLGNNHAGFAGAGGTTQNNANANSAWLNLLKSGRLTYYVFPDGSSSMFFINPTTGTDGRQAYITAADAASRIVDATANATTPIDSATATARIADRTGYIGWAFAGTESIEFSYTSLRVGKLTITAGETAAGSITTHDESKVTWLAEHTQKDGEAAGGTGSGSTGGESGGESGGDTTGSATGTTIYTDFSSAVDTTAWTITNTATTAVSGGQLAFTNTEDADAFVSTGTYTNFILEYDIYFLEKALASWFPIAMFGGDTSYSSGRLLYINRWAAVHALPNGSLDAFIPGVSPFTSDQTTGFDTVPLHVKLVVQDGVVTLTLTKNGLTATHNIATGWNCTGQVGIPANTDTSFTVDNLVLINSDEYADYTVTQMTLANQSVQANAGDNLTGNLKTRLAESYDISTKGVSFRSKTDGFFIDATTGAWEYEAGTVNGTYVLEYVITVNDLVLDGWVYPLGDNGIYTIEGSIAVDVMGGTEPDTEGGGGSGDTSELPEIVGDVTIIEHIKGEIKEVSFVVDTKDYTIIEVTLGSDHVKSTSYTLTVEDTGTRVTLNGNFMALLSAGDNEFSVFTGKGSASIVVRVTELLPPETSGATSVTMKDNAETDAAFTINTNDLEIISVYRVGATYQLNDTAYTYADGVLTLKKEYLATLSAGSYTFQVTTDGGNVQIIVVIQEVFEPILLSDSAVNFTKGITQSAAFELDTSGETITQIVRTGASKALGDNAYTLTELDETSYTVSFTQAYLSTLSAGSHEFTISTIGGDVKVTITVIDAAAPTCVENSKSITFGATADVTFTVNTSGQPITAIVRTGAEYGLNSAAYTFSGSTLKLVGDYVSLLPVGSNEFTVETLGGTVKLYVVVEGSQLSAPTVTLSGNQATWTEVDGATGYTYKIGENGQETVVSSVTSVTLTHNQVLYVKANGNGSTSTDSEWATSPAFVAPTLGTPVLSLSGNRVSWTAIENVTTYTYKIDNGAELTTNNTYVDLTHNQVLVVKASGDNANYLDSNWSSSITYTAPTLTMSEVKLEGNVAIWTEVEGATGYTYRINGGEEVTTNELSKALTHGEYIEVKANGNGETTLDSAYCTPVTYTADALATPVITLNVNVASWEPISGATKYAYTINDVESTTTETSVTIYHNDVLVVWAVGNNTTSLDSAKSLAVTYTAERLAKPVVTLNSNIASWTALEGVTYQYKINDGTTQTATGNSITLVHNQKLVVWAVGDNKTSLNSLESDEVTYTASTLTMSKVTLNGNVAIWTEVEGAVSYTYKINGGVEETTNELFVSLTHNQYIEVRANGNNETTLTSGWSDALTYTAPTLENPVVTLNENVASWTVDENATKYVYKIGLNGEVKDATGNSVQLKHGEAIYVMAIGNDTTSLSSAWSTAVQYKAPTLATPVVELVGNKASWSEVAGATQYAYKINNGAEKYTTDLYVELSDGQKLVVMAIGNGETSLDSAWSTEVKYSGAALAMPTVTITNNVASWTAVEGATGYVYKISEYGVETQTSEYSVTLVHGQTIYVKAIGNGKTILDSQWSAPKTYVAPTLATPVVSLSDNVASWTVESGVSYEYKIGANGEVKAITENSYTLSHGESIYVRAVGNGETSLSSAWSTKITFTAKTLVMTAVTLEGNKATWTAVDGATSYVYSINGGAEQTTTETSVTLQHGEYVKVKAVGDAATTLESAFVTSEKYEATPLATPEVKLNGNVASWEMVAGATQYAYTINGGEVQYTEALSVELPIGATIAVKAVGDNKTTTDGTWSTVQVYVAPTLATPVVSLNGNVASWTVDENATKYVYKIGLNGEEQDATGNTVTLKHNETIFVKAISDSKTAVDSAWSSGVKYTATTLVAPTVTLNGNTASWTAVENATTYVYAINGGEEVTTSELSVSLKHGETIVVKAVGNGETTLSSIWSVSVTYIAPTLARPTVTLNGNVASWTAVENATTYAYAINGGEEVTTSELSVSLKHGEYVVVKAVGNGETTLSSVFSAPAMYVAPALDAPVVSLNGNVASWTAVENATTYAYTISGGEEQTTNELSVSLKHGETIVVKAVGNNETTLDSVWSNSVTYTAEAVATPVVTLNENVASWTAVDNATAYAYTINGGEEQTTMETSVTLENGQTIVVKAIANGETALDSAWSTPVTYVEQTEGPGEGDGEEDDDGETEGDDVINGGATEGNPFEEEIPEQPEDGGEVEGGDGNEEGDDDGIPDYEDVFTGSVKPSEDAYNTYIQGLENGGVVDGCAGSVSVVAGLPIVGIIALFIRKKKED